MANAFSTSWHSDPCRDGLWLTIYSAMLHAIFPGIANLPNIMGKGSALDSGGFIGYVIFWYAPWSGRWDPREMLTMSSIAVCFFLAIPIPKMRILVCKLPSKCQHRPGTKSWRHQACGIPHQRSVNAGLVPHLGWRCGPSCASEVFSSWQREGLVDGQIPVSSHG